VRSEQAAGAVEQVDGVHAMGAPMEQQGRPWRLGVVRVFPQKSVGTEAPGVDASGLQSIQCVVQVLADDQAAAGGRAWPQGFGSF
jgi:hypothetical protein